MSDSYENLLRERITALRIRKKVSEQKMSRALGHSKSYIHNISSGKSLPRMQDFFNLCVYLDIEPYEMLNPNNQYYAYTKELLESVQKLNEDDFLLVLNLIRRLQQTSWGSTFRT